MGTWVTQPASVWGEISNLEAKQAIGTQLAQRLNDGDVVGIGSGSTAFVTVQALHDRCQAEGLRFTAIPSSIELAAACRSLGISTASLAQLRPDWSFDGADEVDPQRRLIKGRGGALFQEKMLIAASAHPIIVADSSKMVDRLGSKFPVPVEVDPWAVMLVSDQLAAMPQVEDISLRQAGKSKDGPVLTERGNLLLDVRFSDIDEHTNTTITMIPGVIETGIFEGFDVELLSG